MIHAILDFLRSLTNPDRLIHLLATMLSGWLGYAVLFGLVFSETGLLVGIVVPGDSLLFTVGVVAGAGQLNIFVVNAVLMLGAMLGVSTGYLLGRQTALYNLACRFLMARNPSSATSGSVSLLTFSR